MDEREITDRLYGPWELHIRSWEEFQQTVNEVGHRYPRPGMVWRGARRAEWGLTSSLHRALASVLGQAPEESDMVRAERLLLARARHDWRFDDMPALEIFAHLQHYGGPTRMLDVTYNPMIALWFAVEEHETDDRVDGRLFAFASGAREIHLNDRWFGRHPIWHALKTDQQRRLEKWGTGEQRRVWRPPAFNQRIAAQNAAFLIDGSPLDSTDGYEQKVAPGATERWDVNELRQVSSLNFRPNRVLTSSLPPGRAPVFTIRVHASAKTSIRDELENRYGIRASSIYSEVSGLAQYLAGRPEQLVEKSSRPRNSPE